MKSQPVRLAKYILLVFLCALVFISGSSDGRLLAQDQDLSNAPQETADPQAVDDSGGDVVLVIDRSGSMGGDRIADAKTAAIEFINFMTFPPDQIGIVSFNENARLDHPLDRNPAAAQNAISNLVADGLTAIHAGINTAAAELTSSRHIAGNVQAMIVLSDGISNATAAINAADQAKANGIRIFSIALGDTADKNLMRAIASSTDDYYFSPTSNQLAEIYLAIASLIDPVSQDLLILATADQFAASESVAVRARVYNSSPVNQNYTLTLTLRRNGQVVDTQQQSAVVSWSGWWQFDFDFGSQPSGSYEVGAVLANKNGQVAADSRTFEVVDDYIVTLMDDWARYLKDEAAMREFDEMVNLVAPRFGYAYSTIDDSALSFVFTMIFKGFDALLEIKEIAAPIGEVSSAAFSFQTEMNKLRQHGAEEASSEEAGMRTFLEEGRIGQERDAVESRHEAFMRFVENNPPKASVDVAPLFMRGFDQIRNTNEQDLIVGVSLGGAEGPFHLSLSTLRMEALKWDISRSLEKVVGIVILLLSIVILVLIGIKLAVGAAVAAAIKIKIGSVLIGLKQVVTLKFWLELGTVLNAVNLLLISLGMALGALLLAPNVTKDHDETLDAVQQLLQGSAVELLDVSFTSAVAVEGTNVTVSTMLNRLSDPQNVVMETAVYSADGAIVDIAYGQPESTDRAPLVFDANFELAKGQYTAVTTLHAPNQIAALSDVQDITVAGDNLDIELLLEETKLAPSDTVRYKVIVTNKGSAPAKDVALLVQTVDGQKADGWGFELGGGESRTFSSQFTPDGTGSSLLQAYVLPNDGSHLSKSAGFVVGNGPAPFINADPKPVYDPGLEVKVPLSLGNNGSLSYSGKLKIITLNVTDPEAVSVYSVESGKSLAPGGKSLENYKVLNSGDAQPGKYITQLFIDGELRETFPFIISATDTLFSEVKPDKPGSKLSNPVFINYKVTNKNYVLTDGQILVKVIDPLGKVVNVSMNRQGTGLYRGSFIPLVEGTHRIEGSLTKGGYRALGDSSFIIAGKRTSLMPIVQQGPVFQAYNEMRVITKNELGIPVPGTIGTLTNGRDTYVAVANESGVLKFGFKPLSKDPFKLTLKKPGFLTTETAVYVEGDADTSPPYLTIDQDDGSLFSESPAPISGITEPGVLLKINGQPVQTNGDGFFQTKVPLGIGENKITFTATDGEGNSTSETRKITLQKGEPTLKLTSPQNGARFSRPNIEVSGELQKGTGSLVNDETAVVTSSGTFSRWVLLKLGYNLIDIQAIDAAGNTKTETLTVYYEGLKVYLPGVVGYLGSGGQPPPITPPSPPKRPFPPDGAVNKAITTTLSWEEATGPGPITYDVYLEFDDGTPDLLVCKDLTEPTCKPGILKQLSDQNWRVVAKNAAGAQPGPIWKFNTTSAPNSPPFAPTNPWPANGAEKQATVLRLDWTGGDPDRDVLTYELRLGSNANNLPVIAANLGDSAYEIKNLDPSTTYYWQVIAKDEEGATKSGERWQFKTFANRPPRKPGSPSPANGTIVSTIGLNLSWSGGDPDGDEVTYEVYLSPGKTNPQDLICSGLADTTCASGTLADKATYAWKVVATDAHGSQTAGPTWWFETKAPPLPTTWLPLGSGAASGGGISSNSGASILPSLAEAPDGSIYVAWGDTSSGDEEIYVRRWNGSSWVEVNSGSASGGGISNNNGASRRPYAAVTPDGTLFVVYDDNTTGDYEIYAKLWNGSSWQEAGSGAASGGGISNNGGDSISPKIHLAPDGIPYLCWIDESPGNWEIYVKRWTGSGWADVGSGSSSGGGVSNNSGSSRSCTLDFAANGTLYLGWRDDTTGDYEVYVKQFNGSSWQEVGSGSASGGGISNNSGLSGNPRLIVGQDGKPYVFWQDATPGNYEIYMKYWTGSSWAQLGGSASGGGISKSSGLSSGSSALILPDGRPAIAYQDNSTGNDEVHVRYWDGANWVPLGNSGGSGGLSNNKGDSQKPSLILTQGYKPTLAWYDNTSGDDEIYVMRME